MMKKINFAIAGCGHIGKKHADMIMRTENAQLVALCDIKDRSQLSLDTYSVPFFSKLDDLLNSNLAFDVVNICTPNGLHAKHALAALHTNRHVVIEKPMALKAEHCSWIIQKAEEKEKKVFCVMQNRYSPPAKWLKSILEQGLPGKIFMVSVNCFWNRDERYYTGKTWHGSSDLDGGTLFTQFSHFIDMLYWLFGDIKEVSAIFGDFNHGSTTAFEDSGIIHFALEGGGIGSFQYSTAVSNKNFESSITVLAENGTIKIGGQYMDKVEYCDIKNYELPSLPPTNAPNNYGSYTGSASNHQYIIQNVVDALNNKAAIDTTAAEGMKVVELIEHIYTLRPSGLTNKTI